MADPNVITTAIISLQNERNKLVLEQQKLDTAISAMKALLPATTREQPATDHGGALAHLPIADAAKHVLTEEQRVWPVANLFEKLTDTGVNVSNQNVLSSILSRRAAEKGDIVRVGRGLWALKNDLSAELALDPVESEDEQSAD